jgi:hypothetical protein
VYFRRHGTLPAGIKWITHIIHMYTKVLRLKRMVLLIMVLAGIAVSTTVYFITKNAEVDNFEAMYEGASEKLLGKISETSQMLAASCLNVCSS